MKANRSLLKIIPVTLLVIFTALSASARKAAKHAKSKAIHTVARPVALSSMKIKNVQFGFNKVEIPSDCYANLDRVAKLMADSSASLKLGGYADNKGGYVYNWKLSKKRADAVKAYLINKGADSSKIASVEYGFTHPIASNATPTGRQKNRRVEIQFAN